MSVDLLVTDAEVVLPGGRIRGWLAVDNGRIAAVGHSSAPAARRVIDARGAFVIPGLVDLHVHFRDPDQTHKEDFASGSLAAAFGGVTTVVDMPNDESPVRTPSQVRTKIAHLDGRSHVDFGLYAELDDSAAFAEELQDLGLVGLKWYLGYDDLPASERLPRSAVRRTLEAAARVGLLVGVHAEASRWITDLELDLMRQGRGDPASHGDSRPPFVEAIGIAEAVLAAIDTGCRLHVHHLSSALGLETVLALRAHLGLKVSVETCPHYLVLSEEHVQALGSEARVNPPIRTRIDNERLWAGLLAGEIDVVASDHAPHLPSQKRTDSMLEAKSGLIGVETLLPLMLHEVSMGKLPIERLVEITAERPAQIAGLHTKGQIVPGRDADFVIVDTDAAQVISNLSLHSKHPYSVYDGWERRGRVLAVYLRGEAVVEDGRLAGSARGRYVRATPRSPKRPSTSGRAPVGLT